MRKKLEASPLFQVVAHTGDLPAGTQLAWFWEPDIILVDIKTADRSRCGPCRRLALASPQSRLVILASYLLPGDRKSFLAAGADKCLLKGISVKELIDELVRLVEPMDKGAAFKRTAGPV